MLGKRVLVAVILLPSGLAAIVAGGWYLTALVAVFMGLAAWEYATLFRTGGLKPAGFLVVGGALLLVIGRNYNGFESAPWMISLFILLAMTYHLVTYERGRDAGRHRLCGNTWGYFLYWLDRCILYFLA